MNNILVNGLIGEEAFAQLLVGLPNDFFGMHRIDKDALWKAILAKINEGVKDIQKLILFANEWIRLYGLFAMPQVQL
jgi:hypothetical protein